MKLIRGGKGMEASLYLRWALLPWPPSAYLCHWGWMPAPRLHPAAPRGWPGPKAGGMPGAQRESRQGCQAPGGEGGGHSCHSGGEPGRGAHQGYQGSAGEEGGEGLSGPSLQASRAAGTLKLLPSLLLWPLSLTHGDTRMWLSQVTDLGESPASLSPSPCDPI